jgi:Tfp pilus assembly protein PilO
VKLNTMSMREQLLVLITVAIVVGGGYALLRGWPAYQELMAMEEATAKTEERVKKAVVPDLPEDDEDSLQDEIYKAENALAIVHANAEAIERRIAPSDSQELKLHISSLAQQAGVLIHANKAYVINPLQQRTATPAKKAKGNKKAAALTPQPTPPKGPAVISDTEPLTTRIAPGTLFERPMQQLSMEGDFAGISHFIQGLSRLPWQVTVVHFKLETRPVDPPPGYPQRLSAHMILAL